MICENGGNVAGGVENVEILMAENEGAIVIQQLFSCTVSQKVDNEITFRN